MATFVVLFGLLSYGIAVFGMISPATMFEFTYDMGLRRASAMYADKMYSRNPTEENRYRALDFAIEFGRHQRVVKLFVRQYNIDEGQHLFATTWHRGQFVWALLEQGRYTCALGFVDYTTLTPVLARPCYLYFVFANHTTTGITEEQREQLQSDFYLYIRAFYTDFHAERNAGNLSDDEIDIGVYFLWFVNPIYIRQRCIRYGCGDCHLDCV